MICVPPVCATSRCRPRASRRPPDARSRTGEHSARWFDGAPDVRDGSAASDATSGSTAPASTASLAPEPGAPTASSLTPRDDATTPRTTFPVITARRQLRAQGPRPREGADNTRLTPEPAQPVKLSLRQGVNFQLPLTLDL